MKMSDVPIPVLVSGGIILAFFLIFVAAFPFLSGNLADAQADNRRLENDLRTVQASIDRARTDYAFVQENEQRFEEAMASDEIIPHTRRAAARHMQTVALENGLTSLNYNFDVAGGDGGGARGGQSQASQNAAYSLHTETIDLQVGAPLDRPVYAFIEALTRTIPGTVVVQEVILQRAERVTTDMLNRVAQGQNSGIVTGSITFSWRTAQANREAGQ